MLLRKLEPLLFVARRVGVVAPSLVVRVLDVSSAVGVPCVALLVLLLSDLDLHEV